VDGLGSLIAAGDGADEVSGLVGIAAASLVEAGGWFGVFVVAFAGDLVVDEDAVHRAWRPPLRPLYNDIVVQPLGLAPAQTGGDGSRGLLPRGQLRKYQMRLVGGKRRPRRVNEVLGADRPVFG
jgi:hypothetical protein